MPLTSSKFYQLATEAALALPGTELYRFTSRSEAEATRVGSKRFMLLAQVEGRQLSTPKRRQTMCGLSKQPTPI